MKKLLPFLLATICISALAEDYKVHRTIYINGIQNTRDNSDRTRVRLQAVLRTPINHPTGKIFTVTNVWNPIGWYGSEEGDDLEQDLKELFLLKTSEESYSSAFERITLPNYNPSKAIDTADVDIVANYFSILSKLPGNNSVQDGDFPADAMQRTSQATIELRNAARENLATTKTIILANLMYAKVGY